MTVTTEKFHDGTGSAHTFDFPFQYLKTADVKVKVGGVLKSESTHYNVSNNNVVFTNGNYPVSGTDNVHIYRETDTSTAKAVYAAGSSIRSADLNNNQDQVLFSLQEKQRFDEHNPVLRSDLDMNSKKITELATPTADTDAANKAFVTSEITAATETLTKVASNAPTSPTPSQGDRFFDSEDGRTYVYVGSNWIDSAPQLDTASTAGIIPDGNKGDILVSNNGTTWTINSGSVDNAMLSGSIALSKITINDLDIGTAKLANDAGIGTAKIADDAITSAKIADNAVTTALISDDNVTLAKLEHKTQDDILVYGASGAPTVLGKGSNGQFLRINSSGNLAWETFSAGSGTVTSITPGLGLVNNAGNQNAITSADTLKLDPFNNSSAAANKPILSTSFTVSGSTQYGLPVVRGDQITNLNASALASGTVSTSRLPASSTTASGIVQLSNSTTSTDEAKAATSKALKDVKDAIPTTFPIADNAVTTNKIADANINAAKLNTNAVTTDKIAADAVTGAKIADDAIDSEHLVNGSIDSVHVANVQNSKVYNRGTDLNGSMQYQWSATKVLQERINVRDYGAVGNGSTDDKQAIQNAINAVPSGGGVVYFPSGTYRITGKLTLSDTQNCIILEGCGADTGPNGEGSIIYQYDGVDTEFIEINGADSITIRHLLFKGGTFWDSNNANLGTTGGNGAITAYRTGNGGNGHLFEHLRFLGITNSIGLYGTGQCTIRNIIVQQVPNTDDGDCIKLDQNGSNRIDQVRIDGCVIDGSPYPGQTSGYTSNGRVRGLGLYNEMVTIFVSNTSLIRCKTGVFINSSWDGDFLYFNNVEAERANEHGYDIAGPGNYIDMVNCFASTNNQSGVALASSFNGVINITNLNARDNNDHGININCLAQQVSIVNPVIGGNNRNNSGSTNGISIGSSSNNISILGGKIGGTSTDLSGTGNQHTGISVNGNNHTNMRFIGVNVTGNSSGGIGWQSSGNNVNAASDNFIQHCPGYSTGQTSFP